MLKVHVKPERAPLTDDFVGASPSEIQMQETPLGSGGCRVAFLLWFTGKVGQTFVAIGTQVMIICNLHFAFHFSFKISSSKYQWKRCSIVKPNRHLTYLTPLGPAEGRRNYILFCACVWPRLF